MLALLLVLLLVWFTVGRAKVLWAKKDGGPFSKVWAWGVESKRLGSVLVLRFRHGSRDAHHSHAFDSVSWVMSGGLHECFIEGPTARHWASWLPIVTRRADTHKVYGLTTDTWVLTFRGPWSKTWFEVVDGYLVRMTHGRKVVAL